MRIPTLTRPAFQPVTPPAPPSPLDVFGIRPEIQAMIAATLGNLALWVYLPGVESIEGEADSLEATPRGQMAVNTVLILVINGAFDFWKIEAGTNANDWDDEENPLGRVADYAAANQYIFRRVKMPAFI